MEPVSDQHDRGTMAARDRVRNVSVLVVPAMLAGMVVACAMLAARPAGFDYPILRAVAAVFGLLRVPGRVSFALANAYSLSGVLFIAGIWYCWLRAGEASRARLLTGLGMACTGAAASWLLQRRLSVFHRSWTEAFTGSQTRFDGNSFPSDHAAVWTGMATVLVLSRPRLGWVALAADAVINLARIDMRYHYPTDVLAGAAWGALFVCLGQTGILQGPARAVVTWSERHPAAFAGLSFMVSYQLATLFQEVRWTTAGLSILHRG